MADRNLRFGLISRFEKNAKTKGLLIRPINKHHQQWAAESMIESYGYDECIKIIDYYFNVSNSPDWNWLVYNSEKILQSKKIEQDDKELRARLRQGAKKWLED